jgi:hypothetical protein
VHERRAGGVKQFRSPDLICDRDRDRDRAEDAGRAAVAAAVGTLDRSRRAR